MKRIIALFLVTFLVCLTGCGEKPQEKVDYNRLKQVDFESLTEDTIIHDELTNMLPTLKDWISTALSEKTYLDWEQFEKVAQVREFKREELAGNFSQTTAFYVMTTDTIIICPKFFRIESEGQRTYSLIHETIHSLVGAGRKGEEKSMNLFVEGITDLLTYTVLSDRLEYDLTYKNEICCLSWLMSVYGTDTITEKICCGEILDFIDEKSEIGNGARLHECLATIDQSTDQKAVKEAVWTEMEILAEVSKNSPNPDSTWKLLEQFRQSYAPYL